MENLSERQIGFATFTALAAPMALLGASARWPATLIGVAAALLAPRLRGEVPQWLRGVYLVWILLVMAKVASMSRACFEDQTGFLPLALLALAAVAGRYGGEVAGRIGALLWPTVAALLVGLMAFAVADAKWDHIVRAANDTEGWTAICAVMFVPMGLGQTRRGVKWGSLMAAGLGLAVSIVACGVLGQLQGIVPLPLYNMVQGVSILGVAERLEALLSVALCIGFFLALALLCAVGKAHISEDVKRSEWWIAIAALGLSGSVSLLPSWVWFGGGVIMGVILPVIQDLRLLEKNKEKARKKA